MQTCIPYADRTMSSCGKPIFPQPKKPFGRRRIVAVLLLAAVGIGGFSNTAHGERVYSVGSLNTGDQFIGSFDGFRSRMAELGYREKHNVRFQYYTARGNSELLTILARKLVEDKVDLIVTSSTSATVAAVKATEKSRTPVLFLSAGNPQKLVKSYAGSGNNVAGISSGSMELVEKRFELLKELAPAAKRVAVMHDPDGVNYKFNVNETRTAAARLGFVLNELRFTSLDELEMGARKFNRGNTEAGFVPPDALMTEGIDILVKQSIREKIPLITSLLANVQRGCLATYAANYRALGRQAAALADKILKGVHPGSLPIELPDKIELVINLRTAKAIDLKVPKEILLRADDIFE